MADQFSQIQWWLQSGSFGLVNNDGARRLRNEKQADWLEEHFLRIYQKDLPEDVKPSTTATAGHSVESMVNELAQRVGLQGLEKQAGETDLEGLHDQDPGVHVFASSHDDLIEDGWAPYPNVASAFDAAKKYATWANVERIDIMQDYWEAEGDGKLHQKRWGADRGSDFRILDDRSLNKQQYQQLPLDSVDRGKIVPPIRVDAELLRLKWARETPGRATSTPPKTASLRIPLSKSAQQTDAPKNEKSPDQLLREMKQYLITYQLRPTHGMGPAEASYNALKEKFGPDTVQKLGREAVMKMVEQTHKGAIEPNLAETLPRYDGSPTPLKSDQETKTEQMDLGNALQK